MGEGGSGTCTVACDTASGVTLLVLTLPGVTTVAEVLQLARGRLRAAVDWDGARVGVWGVECTRERLVASGDRVEVYRELPNDPKAARRQRARRARRK
jgi:putative ubiquitin-RnfH superfamily antitoxin RatB of RatAB toxin-antitoxin module